MARPLRPYPPPPQGYVRPHLELAITDWSPWTQADIQTLEKVQQRAVKMISELQGSAYEERLRELKLLSLADNTI